MKPSSVTLSDMLDARERRANAQAELLAQAGGCLVSLSLNIAGDVKRTQKTRLLFDRGMRDFASLGFPEKTRRITDAITGTEALILLDAPAETVKQATERLEDAYPAARLFDFDVLNARGEKLSRSIPRRCLVCDGPAAVCARSRAHGLDAIKTVTEALLDGFCADMLAEAAHRALLSELHTTPKPGLVDEANNGAHTDMDVQLFERSADTLVPYFKTAAQCGLKGTDMSLLKANGRQAECEMFSATHGVNTHKGIVYSMGLLLYGMGHALTFGGGAVECAAALAKTDAAERLARAEAERDTNGAKVYAAFGAAGAVGEAMRGFPHAVFCADRLQSYRKQGKETAGALALCDTMAILEDTNLLHRGGREGLSFAQTEAKRIEALPEEERIAALEALDAAMIAKRLSPGGSADMLALAYLIDAWRALSNNLALGEVRV